MLDLHGGVMIIPKYLLVILSFCLLFVPISIHAADDAIGYIKTAKGEASIIRGKNIIPAQINQKITIHDMLKTGPNSSLGITLKDDTMIALGSNSEIIISEFDFSPGEGKMGLFTRLLKGCIEYASGIIGKLAPEKVKCATPVGDIGLRGTRFAILISES